MSDRRSIKLEQMINKPVDAVWRALTEGELLAKWWAPGDVRAEEGAEFDLDMGAPFGKQHCVVEKVVPQSYFRYSFSPGMLDTVITWELAAEGASTRLSLEHAGFDADTELGRNAFQGMGRGWPFLLKKIEEIL